MNLPTNKKVSSQKLASVFNNTSATYKFYWFLAILDSIDEGVYEIDKKLLFSKMLSIPWYTINYFKISFGKQDLIQQSVQEIMDIENISIKLEIKGIADTLYNSTIKETLEILKHFDNNVPHKFLSPWLGSGSKTSVYSGSQSFENDCMYAIYTDKIVISENWKEYLKTNSGILKSFTYWNLSLFLQIRNSNVPNIPSKLIKPITRGSLSKHKSNYWDLVIDELEGVDCIYTGKKLYKKEYAVEHFVPYQYLVHDLMWNLVPADPSFNSFKGNKLPKIEDYFHNFYKTQEQAFEIIKHYNSKNKFLEDYLPIIPDLKIKKELMENYISPIIKTAHNNGFQYLVI